VRAGVFDSVGEDTSARAAAFWFLVAGGGMLLAGALGHWVERELNCSLPAGFGWGLLGLALFCVVPMPITGAWVLFPLGLRVLFQARRPTPLPEELRPFAGGADHGSSKASGGACSQGRTSTSAPTEPPRRLLRSSSTSG
jgi:hypothetical protein